LFKVKYIVRFIVLLIVILLPLGGLSGCGERLKEKAQVLPPVKWFKERQATQEKKKLIKEKKKRLHRKARRCMEEGKYQKAERYLKHAIELDPKDAFLYYELAKVCEKLNKNEESIKYYMKALRLEPRIREKTFKLEGK
jgi:tetratricopeptide (TPR) repeat protein